MRLLFLLTMISTFVLAQETYNVNAEDGLTVRTSISGKRIGKIPYGYFVKVIKKLDPLVIKDGDKSISGNWVKIDAKSTFLLVDKNFTESYDPEELYVFNGYLTDEKTFLKQNESIINKHPALSDYYIANSYSNYTIIGDFFADGVLDYAFRMISPEGNVRLMVINYLKDGKSQIYGLGGPKDPFGFKNYKFDYLYKAPKNNPFWADDKNLKSLNTIDKNDIVTLSYDAIYANDDKNTGGYIYRKNKKWNILK